MSRTSDVIKDELNNLRKNLDAQKWELRVLESECTERIQEKKREIDRTESNVELSRAEYFRVLEMEQKQRYSASPTNTSTELHHIPDLLYTLQELHAPDRCEGIRNDIWHGMQRFANAVTLSHTRTQQQILTDWWNSIPIDTRKAFLKMLVFERESKQDFWEECLQALNPKPVKDQQEDLHALIDGITAEQVQLLFNVLIVKWVWRSRMLDKWTNNKWTHVGIDS
jgi:hypothetical protein